MAIVRYYLMTAAEGRGDDLLAELTGLAAKVRPLAGCQKVELYREPKQPLRFHFLEHWDSVDDHRAAGALLGKETFAPVAATLAGAPESYYLDPVAL